jgi:hypothetical protein
VELAKKDRVHEDEEEEEEEDDAGRIINKDLLLVVDNTDTNILFPASPESSYISSKMAMVIELLSDRVLSSWKFFFPP